MGARSLARAKALQFEVLDFDKKNARQAGEIRAVLAKAGMPIRPYDVLIAGRARARDLTLITHNVAEFSRVESVRIEDWEFWSGIATRVRPPWDTMWDDAAPLRVRPGLSL